MASGDKNSEEMRMNTKAGLLLILLAVSGASGPAEAAEQKYPDRPVRMLVPFPAGSASDFLARVVSARMSEVYGQQMVVDNRSGAGGLIGSQIVAKSAPDGYTISM